MVHRLQHGNKPRQICQLWYTTYVVSVRCDWYFMCRTGMLFLILDDSANVPAAIYVPTVWGTPYGRRIFINYPTN